MNISNLTNQENALLVTISKATGSIEEKELYLKHKGVFDDYKKIFNNYSLLHTKDLEALKRCLFLYWYSLNEPSCYTGLGEFDTQEIKSVLMSLNELLSKDAIDYELEWMFNYYASWDYIFEPFSDLNYIQEKIKESQLPLKIDQATMSKRGQMGKYWSSINFSNFTK